MKRGLALAAVLVVVAALSACRRAGPPSVVLVVLDTVRADRLSLCGYSERTSPVLEGLVADGFAHTCHAAAPGSWTVPSHASFFTGVSVLDHGAGGGEGARLGSTLPTLAERFAARGYRTAMLSGNPLLGSLGLDRGFQHTRVAPGFGVYRGRHAATELRSLVGTRGNGDPPLFVVVNLAEAHHPWPGADAPRWRRDEPEGDWMRFVTGRMQQAESQQLRARVSKAYDHAVSEADATLGRVLQTLEDGRWCGDRCRIVITSDHGEFLGEEGLLDHGFHTHEANARVFAVTNAVGSLPSPLAGTDVHDLLLDGVVKGHDPVLPAWPNARRCVRTGRWCKRRVAAWRDGGRVDWVEGTAPPDVLIDVVGRMGPSTTPSETELLREAGYLD